MDDHEVTGFDERFDALVRKIREEPALVKGLPGLESRIVHEALAGEDSGEIARRHHVSEAYVWALVSNAARQAGGAARFESAGMGSDTDPGVTGGYGETGFGDLSEEPPQTGTDQSYEVNEANELSQGDPG